MAKQRESELENRIVELEKLLLSALATIEELRKENAVIKAENAGLKRRLGMDSNNSSKPPSSDGYKPKPKSLRKTGGKNGGQPGHPGKTLRMSDKPDEIVVLKAKVCSHCHADISELPVIRHEKAQVVDLPEWKATTTEYQKQTTLCSCGHENCCEFPRGVAPGVQYGGNIKALVAYLNAAHFIPVSRCCEILYEMAGVGLCEATILKALSDIERSILPHESTIRENLLKSPVIHGDETGIRINKKLHWLHVASNKEWTLYGVHEKRGFEAIEAIGLLPKYDGILEHDFYRPYLKLNVKHAFCCAHLMRECQGITDNDNQKWSDGMKAFLSGLWEQVKNFREAKKRFSPHALREFYEEYDSIVKKGLSENANVKLGKRGGKPKSLCLLERFRDYKKSILRFLDNSDVPFDNNQAERDVRMVKVKLKVSGTFRTTDGAVQFARIRGFISTLRKQNRHVLHSLSDVLAAQFSWGVAE